MTRNRIALAAIIVFIALAFVPRMGAVQADADAELARDALRSELRETRILAARYARVIAGCLNGKWLEVGGDRVRCQPQRR